MFRLIFASLMFLAADPVSAAMPTRADVRHKVDRFVLEARASNNARDWIAKTHLFSKLDKEALLSVEQLPEKMPSIIRRFNDDELTIQIGNLSANFQNIAKGELLLNGEKIHLQSRLDLASAFQLIDQKMNPRSSHRWPRWLYPELAGAEAIRPTCISSRWEFMLRSPTALLESNFGFVGKLFAAGIVVSTFNVATGVFANCDAQISEMQKILEKSKIGLKAIDCGSEAGGSDRNIDFWVPETDEKGAFKTRSFNLDYTQLLAQDSLKEEDEEDGAKPIRKKDPALYVFSPFNSELQEIRVRKTDDKKNRYFCETLAPGTPDFAKVQDDIEPFRKIFEYIGSHNSCYACFNQMSLKLRTPNAPAYFPKLKAERNKAKTGGRKAKGKTKNDEDEADTRPAR